MTMRMLIDARHQEETRVAVVKGNRIEEFDFESAEHKQLKGNIYLAKVTRVEPSLQAAFVDYGGNRHGFLAFSEIHPDYYQIPREDREALLREEAEHAAEEERLRAAEDSRYEDHGDDDHDRRSLTRPSREPEQPDDEAEEEGGERRRSARAPKAAVSAPEESAADELRRKRQNLRRRYKIQDVIRRRQVLLVQVVKEERGNKGAALTTYLSLAGRYCVLMPNTSHGGGISRKISNGADRKRLKQIMSDLSLPNEHELHRPHRRPVAHQDRDQARLRLSRPPVGRDSRADAEELGAGADLRRQRPHQARHPRHLQSRHRRGDRRGRRGLQGRAQLHEIADAEPRPAGEAICRPGAVCSSATAPRTSSPPCTSRSSS